MGAQHDYDLTKDAETKNVALESECQLGQGCSPREWFCLPYCLDMFEYAIQEASFGTSSRFPIIGRDGGPGG
jgi:hypothetical protein